MRGAMVGSRYARNARSVADVVDAKVNSVIVAPCCTARRLASSARGIRWPIPNVASITMCVIRPFVFVFVFVVLMVSCIGAD